VVYTTVHMYLIWQQPSIWPYSIGDSLRGSENFEAMPAATREGS